MAKIEFYKQGYDFSELEGCICTCGVFDGIHRGHASLISKTINCAKALKRPSVCITFSVDPDELFNSQHLKKIMTNSKRIECLANCGFDQVIVLDFNAEFASLSYTQFISNIFEKLRPSQIFVGDNFRFGKCGEGSAEDLIAWGKSRSVLVEAVGLDSFNNHVVSSSAIRSLLAHTNVARANDLLGRRYKLSGVVVSGRGEGAKMGFATANLVILQELMALANGVYASYCTISGESYKAAVCMGVPPTYENSQANCEVHILDFDKDIYGCEITLSFVEFLRPLEKFNSEEELIKAVTANIDWVRQNL